MVPLSSSTLIPVKIVQCKQFHTESLNLCGVGGGGGLLKPTKGKYAEKGITDP